MNSRAYFDHVATNWEQMRSDCFSETVREKAFKVAVVLPGRIATALGAGSGFITEGLIQRGVRVIAVDQSSAMLAEMKKRLGALAEVAYCVGDAEAVPIRECSVDYVFANMYLHHVENPLVAEREAVRILRPAGKLVITDLDEHDFKFLREEQHDRWLGFKTKGCVELVQARRTGSRDGWVRG
jgi:ubiquinone/menaquinone biosynthesis C-methylase UbiE